VVSSFAPPSDSTIFSIISGVMISKFADPQTAHFTGFEWTPDAAERILRVPSGFMRDKVQERIESVALDNKVITIDLDLVEKGLEIGRMMMEEMITSQSNSNGPASNGNGNSRLAVPPVYGNEEVNDYPPNQPPKENLNEVSVMSELDKKRSDN